MRKQALRRAYAVSGSALALLSLLCGSGLAQTYSGTWDITTVSYDGGGAPCPSFSFDQLSIIDAYPNVTVTTNSTSSSHPGTMVGTFSSPSAFTATGMVSSSCGTVQYTMTVGFLFPGDRLTGGIIVDWPPFPCGCPDQTLFFSGSCSTSVVAYCTAGTSASGCQAVLSTTGTASATATSGFRLEATGVEGAKTGIFFYAANGRQASPWGTGSSFQCVVPPVRRGGLLPATGTSGLCDGVFSQDLNARWCPACPKPGHNPGAGAVVQAQLWYRDPFNTSNQTTSLSNAIEFTVCH